MRTFLDCRDAASKGAALIIVLAFIVLLTGLAVAYLSRTTGDRQLAKSSSDDTAADLLARSALDILVSDLKQEIVSNQPVTSANIQPAVYPIPTPAGIPSLVRRSSRDVGASRAATISSTSISANGRSISTARWNSHYLIPRPSTATDSTPVSTFVPPDWVLITSQGPASAPPPTAVIGRYAFAVYDEGGLLDMTLAGFPTWTASGGGGNPTVTPTPWATNVGRKGILTFADLTALPAAATTTLSQTQINSIVGWRNYATTQQSGANFANPTFRVNDRNAQDAYGSYLLDFGDPPYPTPCPIYPFTSVAADTSSSRTDQAFMTRKELLKLGSSLPGFNQNVLQYMGTFSRERNQPARDWSSLNNKIPDRFDIGMLSLVKPNPTGAPPSRGKGKGKQRGKYKGDAASILDLFGLQWVAGTGTVTDPHQLAYWNHWKYVGSPGLPSNPNPHVPALRGGRNDFFQLLDYAMTQANANAEDTVNAADIISLGASLIDQNDAPADDADVTSPHPTGTHVTIIETSSDGTGQFVLGWENNEAAAAADTNPALPLNPYNWITDPITHTTKPLPSFTPIVLNHAFSTEGDFGYGLRPEYVPNRFQRVDFHTANSNASILDFFTYNPVDHNYPRAGIVNLNTKNVPVIAAILQSALKTDVDVSPLPNPFPTVAQGEATLAAQDIVNATSAAGGAALNRADIGRLTAAAASRIGNSGYTGEQQEKVPEAIARALCEVTQTRTWNLMIDVIAQTGRYVPGATQLVDPNDPTKTQFIVEGEKRYWLHIALGRDLKGGAVDVLGQQLEEVTE
jgi:hypothetical protein